MFLRPQPVHFLKGDSARHQLRVLVIIAEGDQPLLSGGIIAKRLKFLMLFPRSIPSPSCGNSRPIGFSPVPRQFGNISKTIWQTHRINPSFFRFSLFYIIREQMSFPSIHET
jgi:hypothetical protein